MAQLFTADQKGAREALLGLTGRNHEKLPGGCPAAFLFHPDWITVLKKDIQGWESVYGFDSLSTLWKVSRGA